MIQTLACLVQTTSPPPGMRHMTAKPGGRRYEPHRGAKTLFKLELSREAGETLRRRKEAVNRQHQQRHSSREKIVFEK